VACTVVVSPLLNLIQQQVSKLLSYGLSAVAITSETSGSKVDLIKSGVYRFIYVTPEQARVEEIAQALVHLKDQVVLFVVDETHCIADSSPTFRPEYRELGTLKLSLAAPTMALTGTPCESVPQMATDFLSLRQPQVIKTSLDRPNLYLETRPCSLKSPEILLTVVQGQGTTMVFCPKKELIMDTYDYLTASLPSLRIEVFHASLTSSFKQVLVRDLSEGRIKVVVATSALGMGMDFPNIQRVVLLGLPHSPLEMLQMIGRACREPGLKGKAMVLYPSTLARGSQSSSSSSSPAAAGEGGRGGARGRRGGRGGRRGAGRGRSQEPSTQQTLAPDPDPVAGFCLTPQCKREYLLRFTLVFCFTPG
jgi:ATP-dependent DNA helicase RecQ